MSCGSKWGEEEMKYLILNWSDDKTKSQLEKMHKHAETCKLFSKRMRESQLSTRQCQTYIHLQTNQSQV